MFQVTRPETTARPEAAAGPEKQEAVGRGEVRRDEAAPVENGSFLWLTWDFSKKS